MAINGGNSAFSGEGIGSFSAGPLMDPTPHEVYTPIMNKSDIPAIDSNGSVFNPYGTYGSGTTPSTDSFESTDPQTNEVPAVDGPFQKLENKLSHEKGVTDPAALAASIGRKDLGEKEMARRSAEGRKK